MRRQVTRTQLRMLAAVSVAAADLDKNVYFGSSLTHGTKRWARWKQVREAMIEWFDMDITDPSAYAHIKALEKKGFLSIKKTYRGDQPTNFYSVVNTKALQPILDELHDVHMILRRHLP